KLISQTRSDPASRPLQEGRPATGEGHSLLTECASGPLVEPELDRDHRRIGFPVADDLHGIAGGTSRGGRIGSAPASPDAVSELPAPLSHLFAGEKRDMGKA